MSAADANSVLRLGGKVVKNPTNLSAAYPYGGTELGAHVDFIAEPRFESSDEMAFDDKHANQTVESLYLGESWIVGVEFRQWDADLFRTVFPNASAGTTGLKKLAASTYKPGYRLSNLSCKLLFCPDNPEHPHLYLYKALPAVKETAELIMTATDELTFPCVFRAIPNSSGDVYVFDTKANITL